MDDLVRWLGEQFDEDERIAQALNPDPVASMSRKFETDALRLRDELKQGKSDRVPYDEGQSDALHWASVVLPERMPPLSPFGQARILREIDAKRQLVKQYERALKNRRAHPDDLASAGGLLALHGAVKLLALPYADRPGYREE
jgi:hypothetical protein